MSGLFTKKDGDYWFNNPRKVSKSKPKKRKFKTGGKTMRKRKRVSRKPRRKSSTLSSLKRYLSGLIGGKKRRAASPKRRKRKKSYRAKSSYDAYSRPFSDNPFRRKRRRVRRNYKKRYHARRRNPGGTAAKSAIYKIGFTAIGMLFPLVLSAMIPVRFDKKWKNVALGCVYAAIGYGIAHLSRTTKSYKSNILAGGIAGVFVSEFREYILVKALKDTFGVGAPALPAEGSKAKTELYYTDDRALNLKELGEAFSPHANEYVSPGYIQ